MTNPFFIEDLERRSLAIQDKLTALGYKPFLFIILLEDLNGGFVGEHEIGTDIIKIDASHYVKSDGAELNDTIAHELVHLYVERYHPEETEMHGPKFHELMQKLGY